LSDELRVLHALQSGAATFAQIALSGFSPYSWVEHQCMSVLVIHFAVYGGRRLTTFF
jgi:hypothetical protein